MPPESSETFEPSQKELSPKEKESLELNKQIKETEETEFTAESIKVLREMKRLMEEEERGELEKQLFAECIGEINQITGETRMEVASGKLEINPKEIVEDVGLENFKIIKKDKLISPETGKETNINRIEFKLELTYPNKEKETLRFISLEVPEEYQDLTKCHVYKELIKDTQGKNWAPKLKESFDQKFITWQKEMIREKDDPDRIRTNIPLEDSKKPTDIKRETLKRGMRTMTIEENIILAEMLKRNGFSAKDWTEERYVEWARKNKEKVEEFLGIKDLLTFQDKVEHIYDFSFFTGQDGKKYGFYRGGNWGYGSSAGVFALSLRDAPSSSDSTLGFRCAR